MAVLIGCLGTPEILLGLFVIFVLPVIVLVAAVCAICRAVSAARRDRIMELRARSICVRCGYDLRATPHRCPECGTFAFSASGRPPSTMLSDAAQAWCEEQEMLHGAQGQGGLV